MEADGVSGLRCSPKTLGICGLGRIGQGLARRAKGFVKKVLQGTLTLPGTYSNLIEEAMPEYREDKLPLVGVVV